MDVSPLPIVVALLSVAAMLWRPFGLGVWVYAIAGALLELGVQAIAPAAAWRAIAGGANVYAFLIGMLALSELARSQGVFVWLAGRAEGLAGASPGRMFALVFATAFLVTSVLSNDAAIIGVTPVGIALERRRGGSGIAAAFACALAANVGSFALPTGNPANVLIFDGRLPGLGDWVATFGVASVVAAALTAVVLWWLCREELTADGAAAPKRFRSTPGSRLTLGLLLASGVALLVATALGWPLGYVALVCAAVAAGTVAAVDGSAPARTARSISWQVVPLVAALLVIVAALDRAGVVGVAQRGIAALSALPAPLARLAAGWGTALVANAANNLPVAAFSSQALAGAGHGLAAAVTVGVDLGPNLAVTGSLATLLWLIVLRREGIVVTPGRFFCYGAATLVPSLTAALLLLR